MEENNYLHTLLCFKAFIKAMTPIHQQSFMPYVFIAVL